MLTIGVLVAALTTGQSCESEERGLTEFGHMSPAMLGNEAFERAAVLGLPHQLAEKLELLRYTINCLEAERRDGTQNPSMERTLGHAYYMIGRLPCAILAYRRGLRLAPADSKLHTAFASARAQVQYPPAPDLARLMQPEHVLWPPWLSLRYLGMYAFILYFAACLAVTRWRMTRRRRWVVAALVLLALAAVPAIGTAVQWHRNRRDEAMPVVVVSRDCPLRVGNGPDYPPRLDAPLPRGAEARRLFERHGWLQVELASGVVGWLQADAVVQD